jgi:hypothetical protein
MSRPSPPNPLRSRRVRARSYDRTSLGRVAKLAVTPANPNQEPAITLQELDYVADLHLSSVAPTSRCLTPALSCTAGEMQSLRMAGGWPKTRPPNKQAESRVSFNALLGGRFMPRRA